MLWYSEINIQFLEMVQRPSIDTIDNSQTKDIQLKYKYIKSLTGQSYPPNTHSTWSYPYVLHAHAHTLMQKHVYINIILINNGFYLIREVICEGHNENIPWQMLAPLTPWDGSEVGGAYINCLLIPTNHIQPMLVGSAYHVTCRSYITLIVLTQLITSVNAYYTTL